METKEDLKMNNILYELTIDEYERHILQAALNNHIDNVLNCEYVLGGSESLLEVSTEVAACRELLAKITEAKETDLDDWAVKEYAEVYNQTYEKAYKLKRKNI